MEIFPFFCIFNEIIYYIEYWYLFTFFIFLESIANREQDLVTLEANLADTHILV
jgi:hypothetical protein